MHPSWDRSWIVPSPITLLVAEFLMKTSPFWTKVYEENIFLLELLRCEHPESIIHLSLLLTDMSVTDKMSHCSSSSPISSVILVSGFLLFKPTISSNVHLLVTIVARQIPMPWVTRETFIVAFLLWIMNLPRIIMIRLTCQLGLDCWLASINDSFHKSLIWRR